MINALYHMCTKINDIRLSKWWLSYNTGLCHWHYRLIMQLLENLIPNLTDRLQFCSAQGARLNVCFIQLCYSTTSTAGNSTIQIRLKPPHNRLSRVNMPSHWHMTRHANVNARAYSVFPLKRLEYAATYNEKCNLAQNVISPINISHSSNIVYVSFTCIILTGIVYNAL